MGVQTATLMTGYQKNFNYKLCQILASLPNECEGQTGYLMNK